MANELVLSGSELALMPVMDIALAVSRRNQVVMFTQKIMIEGTDFGVIPGTDKPTLLKPGAEKLTTFFGLSKRFEIIERVEDWTGQAHGGEPFFYYLYRCSLLRGDLLIAEADGSCSTFESKYRWRWVNSDDVPAGLDKGQLKRRSGAISEFTFAVDKAETSGKYGKPAEYWQRFKDAIADGTARKVKRAASGGREFEAWEIGADVYRVPNDDIASQVNTVQKMAQKRALVAATLLAVNASEFYTQDLEDYVEGDFTPAPAAPTPQPEQPESKPDSRPVTPVKPNGNGEIGSPAKLLEAVNREVGGYYKNAPHMFNALNQEIEGFGWPAPKDTDGWNAAHKAAVDHFMKQKPGDNSEMLPGMEPTPAGHYQSGGR